MYLIRCMLLLLCMVNLNGVFCEHIQREEVVCNGLALANFKLTTDKFMISVALCESGKADQQGSA